MKKLITLFISILMFSIGYTQSVHWTVTSSITKEYLSTKIKSEVKAEYAVKFDEDNFEISIYSSPAVRIKHNQLTRTIQNEFIFWIGSAIDQNGEFLTLIIAINQSKQIAAISLMYKHTQHIYMMKQ